MVTNFQKPDPTSLSLTRQILTNLEIKIKRKCLSIALAPTRLVQWCSVRMTKASGKALSTLLSKLEFALLSSNMSMTFKYINIATNFLEESEIFSCMDDIRVLFVSKSSFMQFSRVLETTSDFIFYLQFSTVVRTTSKLHHQ